MGTPKAEKHGWSPLTLHFRQRYTRGHRYLDNCGAFILDCEDILELIPSEIKVSGATMEKPERCLTVTVDSTELKVIQENPPADGAEFSEVCAKLSRLVQKHFPPALVYSNGFAWRDCRGFQTEAEVKAASLRFSDPLQAEHAKKIGMVASHTHVHHVFALGSKELTMQIAPITFGSTTVQRQNPSLGASVHERKIVERRNRRAEAVQQPPPYALSLYTDLVEQDPPVGSEQELMVDMLGYRNSLREEFAI